MSTRMDRCQTNRSDKYRQLVSSTWIFGFVGDTSLLYSSDVFDPMRWSLFNMGSHDNQI